MRGNPTPDVPYCPFIGKQAGSLIKDYVSAPTLFQCNVPRDFSVTKRCYSDVMSVHMPRDGVPLSW